MKKYFGTDGIRGVANKQLTPELALKLGRASGYVLAGLSKSSRPFVLVGRDTRASGAFLESALIAGLLSVGVDVYQLGVIPTPAVAYLTKKYQAMAGVMISASHNPAEDNGIKFFAGDGFKLSDEQEEQIEMLLDSSEDNLPRSSATNLGEIKKLKDPIGDYVDFLASTVELDDSNLMVYLDGANGATQTIIDRLFKKLNVSAKTIGTEANGININDEVGSTHPQKLAKLVANSGAEVGLAFDGDGDRLIAIDENGQVIDGDKIMFICGKFLNSKGKLAKNTIVSTTMSNLGFKKAVKKNGLNTIATDVGDRYVVEEMRRNGYNFGGEQSGHIIFLDYSTTGDGLLSGLQLLSVIKQTGKKLSELASEVVSYPQVLVNVKVDDKAEVLINPAVKKAISEVENDMQGDGRVLVRPSGTEPLLRVMVEAASQELAEGFAEKIANTMK